MPGNELGDRVHNFFAQENSSHGQHQSDVLEGDWPVLNNNIWGGSQRQIDVLNSNSKNYTSQNSDLGRGQGSYPAHVTHGFNFSQPNLMPDFSKSESVNDQASLNGFMYGNQFYQTRQNEANFLAVDTDSHQRHLMTSRGLSVHELQQGGGSERQRKASDRPQTSVPPVSFDLFGGQPQVSRQQASMLQTFQHQQSGKNDMQQLQQELMIRKMQELQRQQQLRQLDSRPQNLINQVPPFTKQASGSQSSSLVNGTPNPDALQNPWTSELGTNWLSRGSSAMQGSPTGLVIPPNLGETQRLMDLVPQQIGQSLYGVPVSSSRGLAVNQYSQMLTDRSSMPAMSTSSHSLHGNQHNYLPDQIDLQDGTSISRQKFQNENMFGDASSQSLNSGMINMEGLQQVNSIQRNVPQQDFLGRQELAIRSETSHERSRQINSSRDEVALDPTEEKILFGSDDNIWAAFGKGSNMSGEAGNLFDNDGLLNGLPSIQSGSWSALMQSAVAETSSSDIGPPQDLSGLNFHNIDGSSANQPPSMHNDNVKQASLFDDNTRMPSALSSGSIPPSDDRNSPNVRGLNPLGHKTQHEPSQRVPTDMPQRFVQSLEEASKWSNRSPLQKSVAEGSQIYGNASQHSLEAERNAKTISATWAPEQSGNRQKPNGWNALAAVQPGGLNIHEAAKLSQNSQMRVTQGEVVHGSALWKSNSVSSSAIDFGPVKSTVGNHQGNKGILSLNDVTASVANSCNVGVGDETSPFVQNNYLMNQWKNANPSAKFHGGEVLGRMLDQVNEHNQGLDVLNSCDKDEVTRHEMESCAMNESSNDSHRSNLSQHTSGDFRESGLPDANDSRSLPTGKQKSTNQLARKVSFARKFQYHPMGNLDEDVEHTYALKQPTQAEAIALQNTHFGHSNFFSEVPRNSMGQSSELQKENKGPDEEPSRGSFSGYAPNISVPFSRPFDSYTSDKASSPSQNMLELLHKVDQSRDSGAMMHLSSSECNVSSQLPEAENFGGSAGRLQRSQSSISQGFGLQLGPPSQRLQIADLSSSSQNAQGTVNSMHTSHAGAGMGEKGMQIVPTSSVQSLPFRNEESQIELKNNTYAGHAGNENSMYKMPGNYHSAFSSDIPYARSQLHNQQITKVSEKMAMNQHIDSSCCGNTSHSLGRGSAETLLLDASRNIQVGNLASSGGMAQQTGSNDVQERGPTASASSRDQACSSQHFGMPGFSRQGVSAQVLHNMWTNVPNPQHTLAAQYTKTLSQSSELSQPNIVESSSAPLTQSDMDVGEGGNFSSKLSGIHVNSPGVVDGGEQSLKQSSVRLLSSVNMDSVQKMEESQGKASSIKNHSDDSPASSASTQKDIEAFGRSLKPNIFSNQNYALLNQMRALKDAENDLNIGVSKRTKGQGNVLDVHQVNLMAGHQNEQNIVVGDSMGSSTGVPSADSTMPSFSRPADILQRNASPPGNVASENIVALGLDVSQNSPSTDYTTPVRAGHPQVSPQMAPSWFNQYGTFKNGQMLAMYNAQKVTSSRLGEPPFTLGKSASVLDTPNSEEKNTAAPTDACRVGSTLQIPTPTSVANGHLSSTQSSQLNVTGQHQVILRPKKRKSATSELHPWYREISDGSQKLWTLSVAEADWTKVADRLTEKVEDDAELIEDGPPGLKSKRRLILTTQLMQQLFRPPPSTILSADASSKHESVTYAACRVALRDACSTISRSSDLDLPCDGVDLLSAKGKPSARHGDIRFEKVIEELMGRARKLENDFLRLDKSASILDLRVECQDLEKFSVINRFAKFHGRAQTDYAESASTDMTAATQKPCPQRYVTVLPMPRSLPDRVQCLSL